MENGTVEQTKNRAITIRRSITLLLAVSFSTLQPAVAADKTMEREQLATLVRQLDMLDRLAKHSGSLPRQDGSRYHFDYARLREDIARVRNGIRDYLTPQRAQPRDPVKLAGDYRLESQDSP